MGTVDRRVDRDDPTDQPGGVGVGEQGLQNPVPGPVNGVAAVSFPHRLPGAEVFRQVTPGNSGAVAVNHPFEDLTGVPERATPPAVTGRQEGFDASPLVSGELLVAVGGGHEPSMAGPRPPFKETRPRPPVTPRTSLRQAPAIPLPGLSPVRRKRSQCS